MRDQRLKSVKKCKNGKECKRDEVRAYKKRCKRWKSKHLNSFVTDTGIGTIIMHGLGHALTLALDQNQQIPTAGQQRTHASRGFTQFSPEFDHFDFCWSRPFMSVNVNMDTRKNRLSSTTFLAQKPSQNSSRSRERRLGQVRGFPECTRGLLSSKLLPVVAP